VGLTDRCCRSGLCIPFRLLSAYVDKLPQSHSEVINLGHRLRADGKWLGLPWVPTDAMCLVLSFAAGAGDRIGEAGLFLPHAAVERIVGQLREMASLAHPSSKNWNPISCYGYMISHDDVIYVPYGFGYVNYASRSEEPHLRFGNIPAIGSRGALLGGAGIGVSAVSAHRQAAVDYAIFLCSGTSSAATMSVLVGSQDRSVPGPMCRLTLLRVALCRYARDAGTFFPTPDISRVYHVLSR